MCGRFVEINHAKQQINTFSGNLFILSIQVAHCSAPLSVDDFSITYCCASDKEDSKKAQFNGAFDNNLRCFLLKLTFLAYRA